MAIGLSIGDNGIISSARNATEQWEQGAANEQDELKQIANFINSNGGSNNSGGEDTEKSEVEEARDSENFFDKETTIKDDLDNEIRIPQDFKVAKDSATKVEDGIVIEDKVGNQFVWIPAKTGSGATIHTTTGDKTIVYQRTAFTEEDITDDYMETLPTDEESSVNINGGYYIGRFEAGDKVSTGEGEMRARGDSQSNEVSIKAGQAPYNWATYDAQKSLAEGMGSSRGYTGTTKMASSYAWDTAINFIQIKVPDYGTNSPQGNYKDTTFSYANIGETEKTETKARGSELLVLTGQTTPVSNIYDMGGNCWERTTGLYLGASGGILSRRGGSYFSNASDSSAGTRSDCDGEAYSDESFRVTLFCSTER